MSDFDAEGASAAPSLQQHVEAVTQRSEFAGLCVEVFQDADRSGKETSRPGDYLRMLDRIKGAAAAEAAVASYDIDRLHRNWFNRSSEEVFGFLGSPVNDPQRSSACVGTRQTSGGEVGVGTTFKQGGRFLGRRSSSRSR